MAKIALFVFLVFNLYVQVLSQNTNKDSVTFAAQATNVSSNDSIVRNNFELTEKILTRHPFFNLRGKPTLPPYTKMVPKPGKELFFYIVAALCLIFAVLKTIFDKYFSDLFKLFFHRGLKQNQLKQQVAQNLLPALLFNIYATLVFGFYIALFIKKTTSTANFTLIELFAYSSLLIFLAYLTKFIVLKLTGWIFRNKQLTDGYLFIIFMVNKIVSILLLPLLVIISLTIGALNEMAWMLSWILIGALFFYRYASAISLLRKESRIHFFHFLIYVSAIEILPTIVLYNVVSGFLK